MDKMYLGRKKRTVTNTWRRKKDILKIVITDGTTEIARSFVYRLLIDNVFGESQSLFISFYELPSRAMFLESIVIEITSFSPNRLHGISYGHDASVQFQDADIVICIGFAREYYFKYDEYTDPFFEECIRISKFYGETIEKCAKRDAKIIVLGNTAATIISKYVKSIPLKNITTLSLINWNIVTAQVASQLQCLPTEVKNIIVWGSNGMYCYPDCRYMCYTNGKPMTDDVLVWMRTTLPRIVRATSNRSILIRSIAYSLANHCKMLWQGTPENEWTCMGVLSDHSYNIRAGIFFSYPVTCKNKQYEIVQDLNNDQYINKYISDLSKLLYTEVQAAWRICDTKLDNEI